MSISYCFMAWLSDWAVPAIFKCSPYSGAVVTLCPTLSHRLRMPGSCAPTSKSGWQIIIIIIIIIMFICKAQHIQSTLLMALIKGLDPYVMLHIPEVMQICTTCTIHIQLIIYISMFSRYAHRYRMTSTGANKIHLK